MKALITGSLGFVGRHLAAELSANGYTVFGIDLYGDESTARVNLLDCKAVRENIAAVCPDAIFHLAAQAAIPFSWKEPQMTYELNVVGTINLLEAVRMEKSACRVLIVGSSDQYGVTGPIGLISESMALHPQNPYAASKKAQEEIVCVYGRAYSLNTCLTRSFNHCGPGQRLGFLVPDLCQGIVQVERGEAPHLKVGNLEAIRDFTDVRDIVRAYRLISERGTRGETYNVGTGIGRKARDVLDMLLALSHCDIPVRPDPERMRVSDAPVLVCDNAKLRSHTGWEPTIPFERTLADALAYYRHK